MRRRPRLVGVLWRWHRRVGLLAGVFVVLLAATGIVLNHSSSLGLDRRHIDWPWLNRAYGDGSADLPAYRLGAQWLFRAADGRVYLDTREVAHCRGHLVGALQAGELLVAGCAEELLLMTPGGELVEAVSAATGLPVPVRSLAVVDGEVAVQVKERWWLADLDRMAFSPRAPGGSAEIRQLFPDRLPARIRERIPEPEQWLTWERVILDLHSGRLFGVPGVLWVDLVGVFLCTLAISGTAMWSLHRHK